VSLKGGLPWQFVVSDADLIALMFVSFSVVGALALLIVFVPATYLLSTLRAERSWAYPALGFVVGLLATLPFAEDLPIWLDPTDLVGFALFGIAGSGAGYVWWAMYRRKQAKTSLISNA